jgi:hypothetical protein
MMSAISAQLRVREVIIAALYPNREWRSVSKRTVLLWLIHPVMKRAMVAFLLYQSV